MPNDTRISKTLSLWLRHKPDAAGIDLSPEGWADVDAVLIAFSRKSLPVTREDLERVVADNNKQRFEFSEDASHIRARQGHSVDVEGAWASAQPPQRLYHGTIERCLPSIMTDGLQRMRRHHVHLSADVETADRVGRRHGAPVILGVEARRLAEAGAEFFVTPNEVWLVDHVPPDFIKKVR